jgi:hypothetical protein
MAKIKILFPGKKLESRYVLSAQNSEAVKNTISTPPPRYLMR